MTQAPSMLVEGAFDARSTGSRVDYRILAPTDGRLRAGLPMILHLHGAMSSAQRSLESAKAVYDAAWSHGTLPHAVVACATTPTMGGFYIDQPGGARWETLIADELPEIVARRYGTVNSRAVIGSSMGGYGALKLAFRAPERYAAVAALSPAVFPGETADAVPERNLPSVLGELHRSMGTDDPTYRHNSVYAIARSQSGRIRSAGLSVFFDCGDADEFGLHDGAVFLDRVLTESAIPHQFRSIAGGGHLDATGHRLADALDFLGCQLRRTDVDAPGR